MTTISTTAVIGEDRELRLSLPNDVAPGEHRIVLVIDGPAEPAMDLTAEEPPLKRVGNVLVHTGRLLRPIEDAIDEARRERDRQMWRDCQET